MHEMDIREKEVAQREQQAIAHTKPGRSNERHRSRAKSRYRGTHSKVLPDLLGKELGIQKGKDLADCRDLDFEDGKHCGGQKNRNAVRVARNNRGLRKPNGQLAGRGNKKSQSVGGGSRQQKTGE
jgi:hypothetical protein